MDAEDLKSAGLKVTLPRLKILEVLESSPSHHLSAEDIYRVLIEQNEEVGVATIYRVLSQFEESGIVQKLNFKIIKQFMSYAVLIIMITWFVLNAIRLLNSKMM